MMEHMTVQEIIKACHGKYFGDDALLSKSAEDVVIDSRKAGKDSLFIAIKGARVDGHSFIPDVMARGALCAISEQELGDVSYPYILVPDCLQALKDLAEHYRRSLDIKVVGISGSVGKTSTKEMIASVLSQKYCVLKTDGNFNNEIGLPLTVFRLRKEHQVAVLEMGISDFGEMSRLAKIARPDVCVITNIGCAHLENLGSREGILKAKTEMFDYMNPSGAILLNGDDDMLRGFEPRNGVTPVFFGTGSNSAYRTEKTEKLGLKGTMAYFTACDRQFKALIPIPGEHMVLNALAGVATGCAFGLSLEEIARGIEALVPISGRNNLIETENYVVIDDCYNANPVSMKSSLSVLSSADTRRVAVLGDMFELGESEARLHYEVGQYAVQSGIEVLICIGALSEQIFLGAKDETAASKESSALLYHFPSKDAFFGEMDNILSKGDTILVKASHGMGFSEIVERLKAFTPPVMSSSPSA